MAALIAAAGGRVTARVTCRVPWRTLAMCWLALLAATNPVAQPVNETPSQLERSVKAAFLYKFLNYVEFGAASADARDTYTIAVLHADEMAAELSDILPGRTVNDRPITVKRIRDNDALADVHVLFIGNTESVVNMPALIQRARQRGVLVVTQGDGMLRVGGAINFVLRDNKVRFEIALDAAEKAGLRLSSRLLAVALQVRTSS